MQVLYRGIWAISMEVASFGWLLPIQYAEIEKILKQYNAAIELYNNKNYKQAGELLKALSKHHYGI